MDNNRDPSAQEESILSVIQQIKDGVLGPKTLSIDVRQNCVEVLMGEGYTESQIAQILHRSEKTIQRDVGDIRKRNALIPNIDFAKQFVGDIVKKGLAYQDYLIRISRGKDVSDADKIQAVISAWSILNSLAERLQTLGYLPLKPKEVVGDIYHHEGGEAKTYAQLKKEVDHIERVARETGTLDLKTEAGIKFLQQRIEKAAITEELADLNKPKECENKKSEDNHEQ